MDLRKMMETGEGVDQLEQHLLDLDDEFHFKCRRCGKCCIHQDTILFNTRDIYNIARKKGMTMQQVIEAHTEVYIGRNSRLPIVHLLSNGPKGACPLLENGRCSVHDCKPTVCALFPLGRVVVGKKIDEPIEDLGEIQVKYILNDHSCGSAMKVNTVRSWLDKFGIPEHDDFFLLWNKVVMSLSSAIMRLEETKIPKSALELLWDAIIQILYLQYDISQELMPQFQAAADRLLRLSEKIMKEQPPIRPTDNTDCISTKKES